MQWSDSIALSGGSMNDYITLAEILHRNGKETERGHRVVSLTRGDASWGLSGSSSSGCWICEAFKASITTESEFNKSRTDLAIRWTSELPLVGSKVGLDPSLTFCSVYSPSLETYSSQSKLIRFIEDLHGNPLDLMSTQQPSNSQHLNLEMID